MMRIVLCGLAVAALAACGSPATRGAGETPPQSPPSAAYSIAGRGTPVVVMQSGLGDGQEVWQKLVPDLSRDFTVITFDRPGHAGIMLPSGPRDPCTVAEEQRTLLRLAGLPPPYLLVGHSLGGLYQYAYAKMYPADVAGIVLLDPTHPDHWETMQREATGAASLLRLLRLAVFSSADRREFDAQSVCLDRLDMSRELSMPGRLLVSGSFRPEERGDYERMLKALRQDWQRLLGAGHMQVVQGSGHYLQKDSPEQVAAALRQLRAGIEHR